MNLKIQNRSTASQKSAGSSLPATGAGFSQYDSDYNMRLTPDEVKHMPDTTLATLATSYIKEVEEPRFRKRIEDLKKPSIDSGNDRTNRDIQAMNSYDLNIAQNELNAGLKRWVPVKNVAEFMLKLDNTKIAEASFQMHLSDPATKVLLREIKSQDPARFNKILSTMAEFSYNNHQGYTPQEMSEELRKLAR